MQILCFFFLLRQHCISESDKIKIYDLKKDKLNFHFVIKSGMNVVEVATIAVYNIYNWFVRECSDIKCNSQNK